MAVTYTPTTNFGAKDSLPTNDPDKVIKGSEFTTEFTALQTAFSLAAPAASPTFTGTVTIPTADINGGAIDGTTIGGTTPAAATFTSVTATTADINGGAIDGTTIGGTTPAAATFTSVTATTADINGGAIDGTTIGGTTPAAATFTSLTATSADINGGNIDGTVIGAATPAAGSFTTLTASDDVNFDSGTFFVDASADAVGIGTTSPITSFTLGSGTTGVSFQSASSTFNSGKIAVVKPVEVGSGNGHLVFETYGGGAGGGERMRIDSSGNLGLGVTPSAWNTGGNLQLPGGGNIGAAGNGLAVVSNSYYNGSNSIYVTSNPATAYTSSNGQHVWFTAPSGTAGNAISFSEAMRIDSSGNLLVGKTSLYSTDQGIHLDPDGTVYGTRPNNASGVFNRKTSDGNIVIFEKDGTTVGSIESRAGSAIVVNSQSSNGALAVGGTEHYQWSSSAFYPWTDNTKDLGDSGIRWDDVYATNALIQTSDRNEKQDIEELSEAERRVAVAAKGLLRKFRWISSVEEKGDDARIHFGIIAQDLQAAFEAEGLDAGRYAMFIRSTWTDEETGEERSRMGVRYSELLAFIIAAL